MGQMSVSQFFRGMLRYHEIQPEQSSQGIVIVNNNGGGPRVPKDTDSTFLKVILYIPLIFSAIASVAGAIKLVPPMLRPLNYFAHAKALSAAKQFNAQDNVKKAKTSSNAADLLTCELADTHQNIASHNRTRAAQLLTSALVLGGSGVALYMMKKEKWQPHAYFGTNEAIKTMIGSSVFGTVCAGWHALTTPSFSHDDLNAIRERGYSKKCRPEQGKLAL